MTQWLDPWQNLKQIKMTHTLVKLSVAPASHGWVVTAIDLSDMVAFDVGYLVHCQVAGEWDLKGNKVKDKTLFSKSSADIVLDMAMMPIMKTKP